MKRSLVALFIATVLLPGEASLGAESTFPGRNGRIVFTSNRAENLYPQIYRIGVDGSDRVNLTRQPTCVNRSPSASPDGKWIGYVALCGGAEEIHIRDSNGGNDHTVGDGPYLVWSPDGSRLIAGRNGELATMRPDGSDAHKLGFRGLPTWSPDGTRIAFVDFDRGARIYVAPVGGGESWLVSSDIAAGGTVVRGPAWSPDGERLVFAGERGQWPGPQEAGLYVAEADGSGVRPLTAFAGDLLPTWAPAARIAFSRSRLGLTQAGTAIWTIRPDGSDPIRVSSPDRGYDSFPVWSPDATRIAFGRGDIDRYTPSQVYVVRADGTEERQVTHEPPVSALPTYDGPAWTADGSGLLYASELVDDPVYDLYTIDADGTRVRRLTESFTRNLEPAWSPDGRSIAFVRKENIFVIRANGTRLRRVTTGRFEDASPSWSPDGTRIAFARNGAIYTAWRDGTHIRRITHRRDLLESPAWSPDGRWIAFKDGSENPGKLYAVHPNGRGFHKLRGGYNYSPSWLPGGRRLGFLAVEFCGRNCAHVYVETLNIRSGAAQRIGEGFSRPAWSPDGRFLAMAGIRISKANGSGERLLEPNSEPATNGQPDWQPRCTISGTSRADRLRGTPGPDVICGFGGADDLNGRMGNDVIIGGDGADRIEGGRGNDRLFGAFGDDLIRARDGMRDIVDGGPGRNRAELDGRRDLAQSIVEIRLRSAPRRG